MPKIPSSLGRNMSRKVEFRTAFTLVEILVVIAIISILMAIAIPAVGTALGFARRAAIRAEIETISQSIEAYKLKYGDFPPDFFDWNLAVRHYRKIFPDIDLNELNLLRQLCWNASDGGPATNHGHDPAKLDRAEAVVWNLGGFSSNPKKPFTGTGGPLQLKPSFTSPTVAQLADAANYAYNGTRENALVDFDPLLLMMSEYDVTAETATSLDDGDLFPVYIRRAEAGPYLYFDSRSFGAVYTNPNNSVAYLNQYVSPTSMMWGSTRPYLSDQVVTPAEGIVTKVGGGSLNFVDKNKFQIISGGLDNSFGALLTDPAVAANPLYFSYPSGQAYSIDGSTVPATASPILGTKYAEVSATITENAHLDNMSSFSDSTLADSIP